MNAVIFKLRKTLSNNTVSNKITKLNKEKIIFLQRIAIYLILLI